MKKKTNVKRTTKQKTKAAKCICPKPGVFRRVYNYFFTGPDDMNDLMQRSAVFLILGFGLALAVKLIDGPNHLLGVL